MTATTDRGSLLFVPPMLCLPVNVLPVGDEWTYEVKWDGYRAIGSKLGSECHLFSRNGRPVDHDFPQLARELCHLRCRSAMVDGEIIAWDEHGKPSLELLKQKNRPRPITLMLFDLMMLNGRDLRDKPLALRRKALSSIMPRGDVSLLSFSETLNTATEKLMDRAESLHLEGIIAKRAGSHYESGQRSGDWVKCRAEMQGTFLIGGYIPGSEGFEELILGEQRHGKLHFVCRLREGFTSAKRQAIISALQPLLQPTCPFVDIPERNKSRWDPSAMDAATMQRCRWVNPRGSVDVAFAEWTADRKLRQPRMAGLVGD